MKLICEECERQADVVAHVWRTYLTNEDDGSYPDRDVLPRVRKAGVRRRGEQAVGRAVDAVTGPA